MNLRISFNQNQINQSINKNIETVNRRTILNKLSDILSSHVKSSDIKDRQVTRDNSINKTESNKKKCLTQEQIIESHHQRSQSNEFCVLQHCKEMLFSYSCASIFGLYGSVIMIQKSIPSLLTPSFFTTAVKALAVTTIPMSYILAGFLIGRIATICYNKSSHLSNLNFADLNPFKILYNILNPLYSLGRMPDVKEELPILSVTCSFITMISSILPFLNLCIYGPLSEKDPFIQIMGSIVILNLPFILGMIPGMFVGGFLDFFYYIYSFFTKKS